MLGAALARDCRKRSRRAADHSADSVWTERQCHLPEHTGLVPDKKVAYAVLCTSIVQHSRIPFNDR